MKFIGWLLVMAAVIAAIFFPAILTVVKGLIALAVIAAILCAFLLGLRLLSRPSIPA